MSADLDTFEDLEDVDLGEDVDEIAIERRCDGDHAVSLNRAEAARAFERLDARGLSSDDIAKRLGVTQRSVIRWRGGQTEPISLRGVQPVTPPSPIALLLEQASGHGNARVRRLAERIEGQLSDLRDLMAQDVEKEKARQEVARLERQLAEAKARLRSGAASSVTTTRNVPDGAFPCRKGCGRISVNGTGRAAHERACGGVS